jgi:LmbE family N-acetylglucosaminyl deacetylase
MQVLVAAAHPDDEILGCGGTITKHIENGDQVTVCIMTDTRASPNEAQRLLGYELVQFHYPDQKLDIIPLLDITQRLENFNPDIVYTHHIGDLNKDHEITARATFTAFRTKEMYSFEVPSSPQIDSFKPNYYVKIDIDRKIEALKCYKEEMYGQRSEKYVRSLCEVRGGEAFEMIRRVW